VDYNTLVRWIRERRMKMVIQAKIDDLVAIIKEGKS
jgi:hypothetical protein